MKVVRLERPIDCPYRDVGAARNLIGVCRKDKDFVFECGNDEVFPARCGLREWPVAGLAEDVDA